MAGTPNLHHVILVQWTDLLFGNNFKYLSQNIPHTLDAHAYLLEAASNTGLNVTAPKGCYFPQLPRDLDGIMKQQAKLPLVTHLCWPCHLLKETYKEGEQGITVYLLKVWPYLKHIFGDMDWIM